MQDEGKTVTVTVIIPHRGWTLVFGLDKEEYKYTMSVNGVDIRELPEAPKRAA